jgi:nitrous oxidase accessory protein
MTPAALLILALLQVDPGAAPPPASLEGRPAAADTSPVQALIDRAQPGDRVEIQPGTYDGDLIVDKAIVLVGRGRPLLRGSGQGSVMRVRAAGAVIDGFDIDGRGMGDVGRDTSAIHVAAPAVIVRNCRIRGSVFGIYLLSADDAVIDGNEIAGIPDRPPGEIGSGIHIWDSQRFLARGNTISRTRDGFYIQASSNGRIIANRASDLRYGLHYMSSDDNVFEDNVFERGAAGAALMFSNRLQFRRNQFIHNRGFASVGLLLKDCDEVVAEDNLIADNARGIFLEGSLQNRFTRNVIALSDMALMIYDSSRGNTFTGNLFVGNLTPLSLSGRRTDTVFDRNYWSDHRVPDLDGDGFADRPYRLSNVFDHLRGNLTAADLFSQSIAARALAAAEQTFPVLDAIPVVDQHPLSHPPPLPDVPVVRRDIESSPAAAGAIAPLMLVAGAAVLFGGTRSLPRRAP